MVVGLRKAISEGQTALQEPFFFTAERNSKWKTKSLLES